MDSTKNVLVFACSLLVFCIICVQGMPDHNSMYECAQYESGAEFESCNKTYQVCEPGFFAMLSGSCFDMCTKCSNTTFTDGYNNCSQCIDCSQCEKQSNSSCVSQCFAKEEEKDEMCSEVQEVEHGSYTCSMTPPNKKGSVCSVSCEDGYHGSNKTIICQENLQWSESEFPDCEDGDDDDEDDEFPLLMVIIIAAAGGACLLVLLVVMVLCCQKRKMLCFKDDYEKASKEEKEGEMEPMSA